MADLSCMMYLLPNWAIFNGLCFLQSCMILHDATYIFAGSNLSRSLLYCHFPLSLHCMILLFILFSNTSQVLVNLDNLYGLKNYLKSQLYINFFLYSVYYLVMHESGILDYYFFSSCIYVFGWFICWCCFCFFRVLFLMLKLLS